MTLFTGISQLLCPHPNEGTSRTPIEIHEDAALWVEDGRVRASGPRLAVEERINAAVPRVDLEGRAVVPGLVESHTHLVFAGDRIPEMGLRAQGETYGSIAQKGGGIINTVRAMEQTTLEEIAVVSANRLRGMVARGVTTCEIKSGYGLTTALEHKHLQAIQAVAQQADARVHATLLAHLIPPERRGDRAEFIREFIADLLIPAAEAGLASQFDVFVESGAFTPDEARTLAQAARDHGLPLKLHVDQLADGNGAALAAELGALSADHLDFSKREGLEAMARAEVIATLLPGCAIFLGTAPWPNGRKARDAGCEVAIATDCNPGSSMVSDLLLCATLASTRGGLSLEEALWGITRGGAKALGLNDRGTLREGEWADFIVVGHVDWRALLYFPANPPVDEIYIGGQRVFESGYSGSGN